MSSQRTIPLSLKVVPRGEMLASPGQLVTVMMAITFALKQLEQQANTKVRVCLVLDESWSTNDPLIDKDGRNTGMRIIDAIISAACKLVEQMGEGDELAVVSFTSTNQLGTQKPLGKIIHQLQKCSTDGKVSLRQAIEDLEPTSGTFFSAGLGLVTQVMPKTMEKTFDVAILVSDGANSTNDDSIAAQERDKLTQANITLYGGGIGTGVGNAGEQQIVDLVSIARFANLDNPADAVRFFQRIYSTIKAAAIQNAKATFQPNQALQNLGVEFTGFEAIERACKFTGSKRQKAYEAGNLLAGTVETGPIGHDETIECFAALQVRLPNPVPGEINFGTFQLEADTGDGLEMIGQSNPLTVTFTSNPSTVYRERVEIVKGFATSQRAMNAAAQSDDIRAQANLVKQAQRVMRKTAVLTGDDDALAMQLLTDLAELETTVASGDAAKVAETGRRKTAVLNDQDADTALADL